MKNPLFLKPFLATISALIIAATLRTLAAQTTNIAVTNPSFEQPVMVLGQYQPGYILGWTISPSTEAGVQYPVSAQFPGGVPDGHQVAYLNTAGSLSQVMAATLQPNTQYALTVKVGWRADTALGAYSVSLYAGSNLLASASPAGSKGGFVTAEADYQATAGEPLADTPLKIVLSKAETVYGEQVDFDDVQLTAVPLTNTAVTNPSFEQPVMVPGQYQPGYILGWTISPSTEAGVQYPASAQFPGGVPDGHQVAYLNTAGSISQVMAATLQPNTQYALTVKVGWRADTALGAYSVSLYAGSNLLASASPAGSKGGFVTAEADYQATAGDPLTGMPLKIVLSKAKTVYGEQVDFDDVQLTAVPLTDVFATVTNAPIATDAGMFTGAAWGDYNNDGRVDLFVANTDGPSRLYRNDGNGVFTPVTVGLRSVTANSTAAAWGDYDNDGNLDLFVVNRGQDHFLYHNQGDGTFLQVTNSGIIGAGGESYCAAWGDYDNDGFLDLFIVNTWKANDLWHNNGAGTFTKVTTGAIVTDVGASVGCAWGDYDNDGWLDLFVANGGGQNNYLYHNNGDGAFTKITAGAIVTDHGESESCTWGDFDNDGYLDLFVANRLGPNFLYRNNRDGTFTKVTAGAIVTDLGQSNGCGWADYDNDGYLDLFVSNWQGRPNKLYHNNRDGTFTPITAGTVALRQADSLGVAWGDFNNDGFPDLFVANYNFGASMPMGSHQNFLFQNLGNGNSWLKVKCVGTASNKAGIGAKVRVRTVANGVEQWQMRQISGGAGFANQDLTALFGLRGATAVDTLRVEWPSGAANELHNVTADQFITVTETKPVLILRPPSGSYDRPVVVSMLSSVTNGTIHFTLDGSDPSPTSPSYSNPLFLTNSLILTARVFADGNPASEVVTTTYKITLSAPTITAQPHDQTVLPGSVASFQVSATGTSPLSYQWTLNGAAISGATNNSLVINGVKSADGGQYAVIVNNPVGSVTSGSATLSVVAQSAPPVITMQPQGQSASPGDSVKFSVVAAGTAPLTYQWFFNAQVIPGATSDTLVLNNVQPPQAGFYTVLVGNQGGSVTSATAKLAVTLDPFAQVTASPIATDSGNTQSGAWGDYDNDGNLDLFVARYGGGNSLYHNQGNGAFQSVTNGPIATDRGDSFGSAWGDYDNDGYLDLFVSNRNGQKNFLYHNNRDGTFSKVLTGPVVNDIGNWTGCAWADYDRDGNLDLFVGSMFSKNALYHNNGDGSFTKITTGDLVNDIGNSITAAWGDYDGDGYPDLFVANGVNKGNFLYHNNRDGTFTKITSGSIVTDHGYSAGCAWGDYDNDGRLDLFVANRLGVNFLYHNNGDGTFTKISAGSVVTDPGDSNGSVWFDYDNDGYLDLFVANMGDGPKLLYHNNGDGTFTRMQSVVTAAAGDSAGAACADFNNDGFPDLFVANWRSPHSFFYANKGNTNSWLAVQCVGLVSNRSAIGAKVRIRTILDGVEHWQMREVTGGDGWGNQGLRLNFGLGSASSVDTLRVEWPSGIISELHSVPPNRLLTVTESLPPLAFNPNGGSFDRPVSVVMLSSVTNGTIHFTLDGSDPSPTSPSYSNPLFLTNSLILTARVFVDGNPASEVVTATYKITLSAPTITAQPQDQTVLPGSVASFQVTATGTPPLSYQWTLNGAAIPGATNNSLVINGVKSANAGNYAVIVSNPVGSVTSGSATLSVVAQSAPPVITMQPQGQSASPGDSVKFSVVAAGTAPLTYQWFFNAQVIPGATSDTLVLNNIQPPQAGFYTVLVGNQAGVVKSSPAQLSLASGPLPPSITSQPADQLVNPGQQAVFVVSAAGDAPLTYQWSFNGSPIAGAIGVSIVLTNVQAAAEGTYTVRVSNNSGSVTNDGAVLNVSTGLQGGTIRFANNGGGIVAPIFDTDGKTPLAGPEFLAQLYAGMTADTLAPVGAAVPFREGSAAGYISGGGNPLRVVPVTPGTVVTAQVRAWDSAKGTSYEQALANGGKTGHSDTLTVTTGGGGSPPGVPGDLTGLKSFSLMAESTPPMVTILTPVAGTNVDENIVLSGTATDDTSVASVVWELDGQSMGKLVLNNGQFNLPGLKLHRGDNHFRVIATDASGNQGAAEVVTTWTPVRMLAFQTPATQQEGAAISLPLLLTSPGDVGGITFSVQYDPAYLANPQFEWASGLDSASKQFNPELLGQAGLIRAEFFLPGTAVNAGTQPIGILTFQSRSVPTNLTTQVGLQIVDLAQPNGNQILSGTDAEGTAASLTLRRLIGDNNANNQLDVGDATIIERLLAGLEPVRPWDIVENDLNQSGALDSGDVIKVLRAVVGLDPQPVVPASLAATGGALMIKSASQASILQAALAPLAPEAAIGALPTVQVTLDKPLAQVGDIVTAQVSLLNVQMPVSGASFVLAYPPNLLRPVNAQSVKAGPIVPASTMAMWNVSSNSTAPTAQVAGSMANALAWTSANGVIAQVTFQVQPGAIAQQALNLVQTRITTDDGYTVQDLPTATASFTRVGPPQIAQDVHFSPAGLQFAFGGVMGRAYTVDASIDLVHWTPLQTLVTTTGQAQFLDPNAASYPARFYRVREAQ